MEAYYEVYEKFSHFTMIPPDTYVRNLLMAESASRVADGCSRAVHDFLAKHKLTERICQFDGDVCYLLKAY